MRKMKEKNLKQINEYIFKALERLDDDERMKTNPDLEIKRCNAITSASKTVISALKTKVEIAKLKEDGNMYVDDVYEELGMLDD